MTTEDSQEWTKTETLCLIKVLGEPYVKNRGENSNEIFIEAASKLYEHGFQRTYIQCKNKWKDLIKQYKEFKKDDTKTEPLFFIELDRILCKLPQFSPNYRQWTEPETLSLINIIKDGHYVREIQNEANDSAFEQISKQLENSGYKIRQKNETKLRWQQLKTFYKSYIRGEVLHFKYFDIMDKLLDWNSNNIDSDEDCPENIAYDSEDFEVRLKQVRKKSNNWSHKETNTLLSVIKDFNYPKIKRSQKNEMFDKASMLLRSEGYKRSNEQCRLKFKHLKAKYFRAQKKQKEFNINPELYCPYFYQLHEIMSHHVEKNDIEIFDDENYEIEYLDYENELVDTLYIGESNESNNIEYTRSIWTPIETKCFLTILKEKNIKRFNKKSFFDEVSNELSNLGYQKSPHVCAVKWKNLQKQFIVFGGQETTKNHQNQKINEDSEIYQFYNEIHEIIKNFTYSEDEISVLQNGVVIVDSEENSNETASREIDFESTSDLKRYNNEFIDDVLPNTKRMKLYEISEDRLVCNYKMDDIQHYCMSLADTIKRLPSVKQAKLKIEIQKLLYKAEFEDF